MTLANVAIYVGFLIVAANLVSSNMSFYEKRRAVCPKVYSYQATREVPYLETYRERKWGIFYTTKSRWNYRTEYYTAYRTNMQCCPGYKKTLYDVCMPVCEPECVNGNCIAPNECLCIVSHELHEDNVCKPMCSLCEHGRCNKPFVCECDDGYKLTLDKDTCEPICDTSCESLNAYCSAPNECTCLDNYRTMNTVETKLDKCYPICNPDCVNGECTAPNVCTCFDGFQQNSDSSSVCDPICVPECRFGTCTAPDTCACNHGYQLSSENICEPICSEPCVFGTCIAPETCSCYDGYGLPENSLYVCEPVCEKACVNGICTEPGTCTCHDGFRLHGDETMKHYCEPDCGATCIFGMCVAPDTCQCMDGYRHISDEMRETASRYFITYSACEPICEHGCVNGFCISPGECTCDPGYELLGNNASLCVPICSLNCVNGYCSEHNLCQCDPGYELRGHVNDCAPVCNPPCENGECTGPNQCTCNSGYQIVDDANICEPICDRPCVNAYCSAPNECLCKDGYRKFQKPWNECEPVCEPSCGDNSFCAAPNTCMCDPGYEQQEHIDECAPVCDQSCENGECTGPNHCSCNFGYRSVNYRFTESYRLKMNYSLSQGIWNQCEPVCEPSCGDHSFCAAPNTCKCEEGYRSSGNGTVLVCEPICQHDCENGTCEAPGVCVCNAGYEKDEEERCKPVCEPPCGDHSFCAAPNTCKCEEGYRSSGNGTVLVCEPICQHDCENGTCEAPGVCVCNAGYEKDEEERCKPFCASCENGTCVEPETCKCNEGYVSVERESENRTVCEPHCENCSNGSCTAPGECQCDAGFAKDSSENGTAGCVMVCENNCHGHGFCIVENATCECRYGWDGLHCEEPTFCVLVLDPETPQTNVTTVVDYANETVASVFASSPLCYRNCFDEIDNETLCFDGYKNDGVVNDTVACIMGADSTCHLALSRTTKPPNYIYIVVIASIVTVIAGAIVYLLIRKQKKREYRIGNASTVSIASTQDSLLPEDDHL